jgi:hypothetical protein
MSTIVTNIDVYALFTSSVDTIVKLRKSLTTLKDFDFFEVRQKACEIWNESIKFEIENNNSDKILLSEIRYLAWHLFKTAANDLNRDLILLFEVSTKTAKSVKLLLLLLFK